jgi:hypothetical protein
MRPQNCQHKLNSLPWNVMYVVERVALLISDRLLLLVYNIFIFWSNSKLQQNTVMNFIIHSESIFYVSKLLHFLGCLFIFLFLSNFFASLNNSSRTSEWVTPHKTHIICAVIKRENNLKFASFECYTRQKQAEKHTLFEGQMSKWNEMK